MKCPDCRGRKRLRALVDGTRYRGPVDMPCPRCEATGEVDAEQERWASIGGTHRTWRVAQLESQGACATRLGITVAALTSMEAGRSNSEQLLADIPAMLRPKS